MTASSQDSLCWPCWQSSSTFWALACFGWSVGLRTPAARSAEAGTLASKSSAPTASRSGLKTVVASTRGLSEMSRAAAWCGFVPLGFWRSRCLSSSCRRTILFLGTQLWICESFCCCCRFSGLCNLSSQLRNENAGISAGCGLSAGDRAHLLLFWSGLQI